jgi:hypothetical protein
MAGCYALAEALDLAVPLTIWFFLGVALGLVWHEGGHLLCATLGGLPVRLVSVGIGPLLWRSHVGDARLDVRLLPLGGMVMSYPLLLARKYWLLAFASGGILGNGALIACVALLAAIDAVPESAEDPLRAVVSAQLFLMASSLLPFRAKIGGERMATDGLQLLQLLWTPRDGPTEAGLVYARMLAAYGDPGNGQEAASEVPSSPASSRIFFQATGPHKWEDPARLREYRETLERELAGDLSPQEVLFALDSLITTGLISGDPEFRARLDAWSLRAIELGPDIETLRGSRGAALVELGRWQEGKAMLSKLAAAEGTFDAFMTQMYLARAEHALGDAAAAAALMEAARKTAEASPQSPAVTRLLPRIEAELAGVRPGGSDTDRWPQAS